MLPAPSPVRPARVFVPKLLAAAVAFAAVAVFCGVMLVDRWFEVRRVRVRDVVLTVGALVLAGAAAARVFDRGCHACRAALERRSYLFPGSMHTYLSGALGQGGQALEVFLRAPPPPAGVPDAARLTLDVCPKCGQLAFAKLDHEITAPESKVTREGLERQLAPHEIWVVAALAAAKPAAPG
jgi:hypothetical protein